VATDEDDKVPHHVLAAGVFAGDRFWAAADQLAERTEHAGHPRWLVGETERITHYQLRCVKCDVPVMTFEIQRDPATAG
jgi:hypothetical protein